MKKPSSSQQSGNAWRSWNAHCKSATINGCTRIAFTAFITRGFKVYINLQATTVDIVAKLQSLMPHLPMNSWGSWRSCGKQRANSFLVNTMTTGWPRPVPLSRDFFMRGICSK